jgi:hypothetical protein
VQINDVVHVYAIQNKIRLNWSAIVRNHMIMSRQLLWLPYANVISRIALAQKDFDFGQEVYLPRSDEHIIGNKRFRKLNISKGANREWIFKEKGDEEETHERMNKDIDSLIPEGTHKK